MREAVRSQLRRLLVISAAAGVTGLVGSCAALAIFLYGLVQVVASFTSDDPKPVGISSMVLGAALLLMVCVLSVRIRDRFETQCWDLIEADGARLSNEADGDVVRRQADGQDDRLAAVSARRSKRFQRRLAVLIEHAWPRA
jgi:hypothetical protein